MQSHWKNVAADLYQANLFTEPSARVHARAMFMCEYCSKYMLDSLDSWQGFEVDHILPQSIYGNLRSDSNNHALACKACNFLKRDYDVVEAERDRYLTLKELTESQRLELIERCKVEVHVRRNNTMDVVREVRKILLKNNLSKPSG